MKLDAFSNAVVRCARNIVGVVNEHSIRRPAIISGLEMEGFALKQKPCRGVVFLVVSRVLVEWLGADSVEIPGDSHIGGDLHCDGYGTYAGGTLQVALLFVAPSSIYN